MNSHKLEVSKSEDTCLCNHRCKNVKKYETNFSNSKLYTQNNNVPVKSVYALRS